MERDVLSIRCSLESTKGPVRNTPELTALLNTKSFFAVVIGVIDGSFWAEMVEHEVWFRGMCHFLLTACFFHTGLERKGYW